MSKKFLDVQKFWASKKLGVMFFGCPGPQTDPFQMPEASVQKFLLLAESSSKVAGHCHTSITLFSRQSQFYNEHVIDGIGAGVKIF